MTQPSSHHAVVLNESDIVLFRGKVAGVGDLPPQTVMIGGRRFRLDPRGLQDNAWVYRPMRTFMARKGESVEQWRQRVEETHASAVDALQEYESRLGLLNSVTEDLAFPDVGDDEYWRLEDAVAGAEAELISAILASGHRA